MRYQKSTRGGGKSDLKSSKIMPSAGNITKADGINRFAIDLLWVRVGGVGGSESYIRNLLDGMSETDMAFSAMLLVSEDNAYSFKHYEKDARFQLAVCPVRSKSVWQRIAWQNLHQGGFIRKKGLKKCFEPVYCMPLVGNRGIDYYTVIHDIQARHYARSI